MCDAIMYSFGQKKKDGNVPLNKGSATQPTTQQDESDGEENTIKERRSIITMLEEMKEEMRKLSEDVAKTQQAVADAAKPRGKLNTTAVDLIKAQHAYKWQLATDKYPSVVAGDALAVSKAMLNKYRVWYGTC